MSTPILVFAKAPVPGTVKTRLLPALSPVKAAEIYVRLLDRSLAEAVDAQLGPVTLVTTPRGNHPVLKALAQRYDVAMALQSGCDLGQRMFHAMRDALAQAPRCVLIGSDSLDLRAGDLHRAENALNDGADVVLGPAADGGYVLIGATRVAPQLFCEISWSSPRVMSQTRHAILALGWRRYELRVFRDLDEPRDLALIPRSWRIP